MRNKIVLTIEEMKRLKELGLDTSDASMAYVIRDFDKSKKEHLLPIVTIEDYNAVLKHLDISCFTYTLDDIIRILPKGNLNNRQNELIITHNYVAYKGMDIGGYNCPHIEYGEPLTSAYNMLIWVIENNYIKTK